MINISEQNIVNQVETLSFAGKRAAAKALGFIHRFQWTVLVGGVVIGVALAYCLHI